MPIISCNQRQDKDECHEDDAQEDSLKKTSCLVFLNNELDLGIILRSDPVKEFDIQVENITDNPVVITDIDTQCHCTTASYEDTIPPQTVATVHVTFDTSDYFAQDIERNIIFYTNENNSGDIQFWYTAKLRD